MKFHHIIFIVALCWYAITAWFSKGYYHADEHYQIIEFAGLIDGSNKPEDLTWEYHAQIRSSLQPVLCSLVFKTISIFNCSDPFTKAFILRLITALMAVIIISHFIITCKNLIEKKFWKWFVVISYFIWFLPFLNVRFSSETWSGLLLLFALSLIIRNSKTNFSYIFIGILFGLAFLIRFQILFAIIGIVFWLIFVQKSSLQKMLLVFSSGLFVVFLGFLLDTWYYQKAVFVFWNNIVSNILEGKANTYGTEPIYYYLYYIFRYPFFPIGIAILLSFCYLTIKQPKNLFIWTIIPYLLIHSLISHKELRFLFPMINLVPIIFFLALQETKSISILPKVNYITKTIVIILLGINFMGLLVTTVKPAGISRVRLMEMIKKMQNKPANLYYFEDSNPYSPWRIRTNYYNPKTINFKEINFWEKQDYSLFTEKNSILIVEKRDLKIKNVQDFIEQLNYHEYCKSVQDFLIPILKIYGFKTEEILIMYTN